MGKPTYIYLEKLSSVKGGSIKDVDSNSRTVTGYAASFDTLDSDGDVFQKGAFSKTIVENKDRILQLLQHNKLQPIGKPSLLKEDKTGLYFETPIANTPLGDDVLQLYKDGVYNEHSVGFEMLKSNPDSKGNYPQFESPWNPGNYRPANIITETKLWEFSTVSWGANANTPFMGMKGLEEAQQRTALLTKALHTGNLTDDTYKLLERELKQLELLLSLEPLKSTQAEKKEDTLIKELSNLKFSK